MMDYIASHGLDIFTTVLGLVYILLEYRASIWLWLVGIIMPALDVWLYWSHGLYGDAGMGPELCGSLGAGTQIYRAVVLLDYRRCRLLLSLYHQRYPIQGRTLRSLRHHRRSRIL